MQKQMVDRSKNRAKPCGAEVGDTGKANAEIPIMVADVADLAAVVALERLDSSLGLGGGADSPAMAPSSPLLGGDDAGPRGRKSQQMAAWLAEQDAVQQRAAEEAEAQLARQAAEARRVKEEAADAKLARMEAEVRDAKEEADRKRAKREADRAAAARAAQDRADRAASEEIEKRQAAAAVQRTANLTAAEDTERRHSEASTLRMFEESTQNPEREEVQKTMQEIDNQLMEQTTANEAGRAAKKPTPAVLETAHSLTGGEAPTGGQAAAMAAEMRAAARQEARARAAASARQRAEDAVKAARTAASGGKPTSDAVAASAPKESPPSSVLPDSKPLAAVTVKADNFVPSLAAAATADPTSGGPLVELVSYRGREQGPTVPGAASSMRLDESYVLDQGRSM